MSDRFYQQQIEQGRKPVITVEHLSINFDGTPIKELVKTVTVNVKNDTGIQFSQDPSQPYHIDLTQGNEPQPDQYDQIMKDYAPPVVSPELNTDYDDEGHVKTHAHMHETYKKQRARDFISGITDKVPTPAPEIKPEKESVSPPEPLTFATPQVKKERGLEYDEYPQMAAIINPYPDRYVSDEELNIPPEKISIPEIFDTEIPTERNAHEIAAEIESNRVPKGIAEEVLKHVNTFFAHEGRNGGYDKPHRLYELNPLIEGAICEATNYAEVNEGELPFDLCDIIEHLEMEREQKLIQCSLIYKDYVSKQKAIEDEFKKLKDRALSFKKKAESLKQYIKMNLRDKEKSTDPRVTFNWKKSTKCVITDIDLIPEGMYKIEKKPIIEGCIKVALQDGTSVVPGAELVESINLSIK